MPPQIAKAVIPAAGIGRRLMPITSAVPKEMFPVGRYPAIEWVIAEAAASGYRDIAVVVNPRKRILREYLTRNCRSLLKQCRLTFIDQAEPMGLGHALLLARKFIAGQPFAVLLPDELATGLRLPLAQMHHVFAAAGGAVFGLASASPEAALRWSERWHSERAGDRIYRVRPVRGDDPKDSRADKFAGLGRYLLSPRFLDYAAFLFNEAQGRELDDGMIFEFMHAKGRPVSGVFLEGQRFDISTTDGFVAAWQHFGKTDPLREYRSGFYADPECQESLLK